VKRYRFDVDGTLCATTGMDYANASPLQRAIEEVRRIHAAGHYVVITTCRGALSGEDWFDETRDQLAAWGLHEGLGYDELRVGVEFFDVIVDDRAVNAGDWRSRIST
jgi:hypothetical protein